MLTGDAIALAVVDYAAALARRESAAEVTIPIRTLDGRLSEVSMLLGPASQLIVGPASIEGEELLDDELVLAIVHATQELAPSQAHAVDDAPESSATDDFGL